MVYARTTSNFCLLVIIIRGIKYIINSKPKPDTQVTSSSASQISRSGSVDKAFKLLYTWKGLDRNEFVICKNLYMYKVLITV